MSYGGAHLSEILIKYLHVSIFCIYNFPRAATTSVGQITLPVTLGTRENFHTKHL
jgi:hypothetical protein